MEATVLVMTGNGLRLESEAAETQAAVEERRRQYEERLRQQREEQERWEASPLAERIFHVLKKNHPCFDKSQRVADLKQKIERNGDRFPDANHRHQLELSHLAFEPNTPTVEGIEAALRVLEVDRAVVEATLDIVRVKWRTPDITVVDVVPTDEDGSERFLGKFNCGITACRGDGGCLVQVSVSPLSGEYLSHDDYCHPHVNGTRLCLGEGAKHLQKAVYSGNLDVARDIVESILRTYNGDSPHKNLYDWDGPARTCIDCGGGCSDDPYTCHGCGGECCEDCGCDCHVCDEFRCNGCSFMCPRCESNTGTCCSVECRSCRQFVCTSCAKELPCCGASLCSNCLPAF